MEIVFTQTFDEDLRNIWDFIAQDNPSKASEVTEELINYCLKYLSVVPEMWQKLETTPEIRKLTWPYDYSIIFQRTEDTIFVLMAYKRAQRRW